MNVWKTLLYGGHGIVYRCVIDYYNLVGTVGGLFERGQAG
jgi:hypothetical protein